MDATAKEAFYNDVYSNHFNILTYLGQWALETDDPFKKNLYIAYKIFIFFYGSALAIAGIVDLYLSLGDVEKVIFNLCITILTTGILLKNLILQSWSGRVNRLRQNLFRDGLEQKNNPEDVAINEQFTKILLSHRKTFYVFSYTVLPMWLATSLLTVVWGPRELPFPIYMPINLESNLQYFCGFVFEVISSIYIVCETIHADLAMFSLTLQISAQYKILAKNVLKINNMHLLKLTEGNVYMKDINKMLLNHRTKEKLKICIKKQLILLGYVKEVESVYNFTMMMQLIAGVVLSIGNGLELMVSSMNVSVRVTYQIGYTLIVLGDVFMCCNLSDLLIDQARTVEWSLYDIAWYEMDYEIRRYILLIIVGAQKVQPLTAAKMFGLNLSTFLGMLKNIYSWLALFRQLLIKD